MLMMGIEFMGEKQNIGVKIHCAGDAAVRQALDAIDVVRSFNGPTELMHHIAHASYIAPDDIAALRRARRRRRPVADHLVSDHLPRRPQGRDGRGARRALLAEPDLLEAGALMAGGSDWPVIPIPIPGTASRAW